MRQDDGVEGIPSSPGRTLLLRSAVWPQGGGSGLKGHSQAWHILGAQEMSSPPFRGVPLPRLWLWSVRGSA